MTDAAKVGTLKRAWPWAGLVELEAGELNESAMWSMSWYELDAFVTLGAQGAARPALASVPRLRPSSRPRLRPHPGRRRPSRDDAARPRRARGTATCREHVTATDFQGAVPYSSVENLLTQIGQ